MESGEKPLSLDIPPSPDELEAEEKYGEISKNRSVSSSGTSWTCSLNEGTYRGGL